METAPFKPSKVICSAGINPWRRISCALDFGRNHYFRRSMGRRVASNWQLAQLAIGNWQLAEPNGGYFEGPDQSTIFLLDIFLYIANNVDEMPIQFTTRQAAKKLGLDVSTLSRYVSAKKVPPPRVLKVGAFQVHSWTEEDIERVRALLPKIANGRKTRHKKKSAKVTAKKQKKK